MIDANLESGWKQHFPTYEFKKRDVAIEEYRTSAKNLESEERVFLNASNIALIVAVGLGSLAVGSLEQLTEQFGAIIPAPLTLGVLLIITAGFSLVALTYFADRQKSVVFAARKVIVLRRMLGLSYGAIQLVLPNWRIEGADEPFAVRLFPGWNTYVTYPYYALAGISSAVIFFLLTVLCALFLAYIYRKALLDIHESIILLLIQNMARFIRLKLVTNFEYIIYRATLARYEFVRLKIDLTNLKKILVFIEDRTFFTHHGLSARAFLRALLGLVKLKRRSGGSTITQQLVRTLFVHEPTKLIRRKIIEIFLALCFNRVFTKSEQLEIYLASVKFDRGVLGVIKAMHHFWGGIIPNPSTSQSFFLIERISNIYSRLLTEKIIQTANSAMESGLMKIDDTHELHKLYYDAVTNGKITDCNGGIERMAVAFGTARQCAASNS
ncbi:penicillin-binding protein [bacterium SM23_31]|nr:MAG: penicillin-binding protein [bacterium SM23_31]